MQIITDVVHSVLSFSSDVIVIIILIGLGTAYSFIAGKRKAISLIFSYYPTVLLFRSLPFLKQYTANNPATTTEALTLIAIFVVIMALVNIVLNRFINTDYHFSNVRKMIESIVLGTTTAVLAILASYTVINLKIFYNFGVGIDAIFSSNYYFYWLILPFVILFLFRK